MATIEARGLRKTFDKTVALGGIDLRVEEVHQQRVHLLDDAPVLIAL